MATTRTASAVWKGSLIEGAGEVALVSSGAGSYPVSWPARAMQPNGVTSPEELIAAAHASCYCMALSHGLTGVGTAPESLEAQAAVTFEPGTGIIGIVLTVRGSVPGLSAEEFAAAAEVARRNCPVSQALGGVPITLASVELG
ncbi:OsmC family peroxiredoxin [Kitasatospora sp. CM 4170]|uniref:OsmC family peroxiredoxin n=1 Tax=Kitasatospora aburaviensis TaxID=67265 RepID=A0ABW1ETQ0_9ACTN|nr:OsmC family peroxiredoxin [Kitasatospora sp. CM 4170]WNM44823.1 OsmC family peroxiredoxin [Kitasatospora sp. CM 4170]